MNARFFTCTATVFLFGGPDAIDRALKALEKAGGNIGGILAQGAVLEPLDSPFGVEGRTWASAPAALSWVVAPDASSLDDDQDLKRLDKKLVAALPADQDLLVARVALDPTSGQMEVMFRGLGELARPPLFFRDARTTQQSLKALESSAGMGALLGEAIAYSDSASSWVAEAVALRRKNVLENGLPLASSPGRPRL